MDFYVLIYWLIAPIPLLWMLLPWTRPLLDLQWVTVYLDPCRTRNGYVHTLGSGYILIALHLILTGDSVYVLYFTHCIDQVLFGTTYFELLNYLNSWTFEHLNLWNILNLWDLLLISMFYWKIIFITFCLSNTCKWYWTSCTFEPLNLNYLWTKLGTIFELYIWTTYKLAKLTSYFCSWYFHLCFSGTRP